MDSHEFLAVGRERRAQQGLGDISKHVSTAHWTAQPCPQNQTTRSTRANPSTATCCPLAKESPSSKRLNSLQVSTPRDPSHLHHLILFGFKPLLHSIMAASVFSNLGLIRYPNVLLLTLTGLSLSSPIRSLEDHRRGDNPLLDAQDFLSHFLSTMNLTELRPQPRPLAAHEEPPEYMLELYNRFAHDHTAVPSASIVRSFKNEGTYFVLFNTTLQNVYIAYDFLTLCCILKKNNKTDWLSDD